MWSATWASVARGRGWRGLPLGPDAGSWPMSLGSRPRRAASALSPASQSAHSCETNAGTNVTMQTPPLPASRASTSSGTLRGWSQTARALEWEKITGASAASSASRMVAGDTWDRSTSMPSRCISRTTSRPNSVSPPACGSSVAESAQRTLALWVSVMYRTPSAYSMRSTPSEHAMAVPAFGADQRRHPARRRRSAPRRRRSARAPGPAGSGAIIRRTRSICSSTVVTAASPGERGRHVHRPELGAHPARREPGQVGVGARDRLGQVHAPGIRGPSRSAQGRSLCPSTSGNRRSRSRAHSSSSLTPPAYERNLMAPRARHDTARTGVRRGSRTRYHVRSVRRFMVFSYSCWLTAYGITLMVARDEGGTR